MKNLRATAIAQVISHHVVIATGLRLVSADGNVFTVEDIVGDQYLVTVEPMFADTDGPDPTMTWQRCPDRDVYTSAAEHGRKCGAHFDPAPKTIVPEFVRQKNADQCIALGHEPDSCREPDDDGDDDEIPANPEVFDGGFGNGSWFQESMRKDD